MRTSSLTFVARDSKTLTKTSLTLYQVAFLGEQLALEYYYTIIFNNYIEKIHESLFIE